MINLAKNIFFLIYCNYWWKITILLWESVSLLFLLPNFPTEKWSNFKKLNVCPIKETYDSWELFLFNFSSNYLLILEEFYFTAKSFIFLSIYRFKEKLDLAWGLLVIPSSLDFESLKFFMFCKKWLSIYLLIPIWFFHLVEILLRLDYFFLLLRPTNPDLLWVFRLTSFDTKFWQ